MRVLAGRRAVAAAPHPSNAERRRAIVDRHCT
jgi:hypothetical protein